MTPKRTTEQNMRNNGTILQLSPPASLNSYLAPPSHTSQGYVGVLCRRRLRDT